MDIRFVDITEKTGYPVQGAVCSWQTRNGEYNVEHLAGKTPSNELIVFWWSRLHDWQAVNVTRKTNHQVVTPVTSWQTKNGPYNVEHLAGVDPSGNLIVFWWSPQHDWQAVNVSQLTGVRLSGPVTSWQTKNGPYNVEHLAGHDANGNVYVFWWSPQHDWQAVNVTAKTGQRVRTGLTSWQTKNGPYTVEHLAGVSDANDVIAFWWSPQHDWQAVNVSAKTGRKVTSAVTSWQTRSGEYNVEHLAGTDANGNLVVSWWSPLHDWQAVLALDSACRKAALSPSAYQVRSDGATAEVLNIKGANNELLHFWWKSATDWQVLDITLVLKKKIYCEPESWLTAGSAAGSVVEHVAAESDNHHLLVFWFYKAVREAYDQEGLYTACWKNIGPKNFTCVVTSLCVDPGNPDIIYAGAQYGGVWKTTNGGNKWVPTMDSMPNLYVNAIGLCRQSPQVIYAALDGDRDNCCRSDDRGGTWRMVRDFAGKEPRAIAVHPTNPDIVYVASGSSLHKTVNGGQSWLVTDVVIDDEVETNDYGIFDGNIDDVKMSPLDPSVLFIVVKGKGFFKSADAGLSWVRLGRNFMFEIKDDGGDAASVHNTSLNGSGRTRIAIGSDTRPGKHGDQFIALKVQATVIVSTDGGVNWRQLPGSDREYNAQLWWNSCIAVCPANEDFLVVGGNGISYTRNANAASPSWHGIEEFHSDQQAIAFSLSDPSRFYFANDGFVGMATENGSVVKNISTGLVACQGFCVDVSQTPVLVAGTATYHTGILRTGRSDIRVWEYMAGNEGGPFVIDPSNEKVMFCGPWGPGDLRRSTNGGSDWSSRRLKAINETGALVDTYIGMVAIRPDDTKKIYGGGFFGHLHYSTDGGSSWDYVKNADGSPFLPDGGNMRANRLHLFCFAPTNNNIQYLCTYSKDTNTGTLWTTTNGSLQAAGWRKLNTPPSATGFISAIAVSYLSPNLVLVGYENADADNNLWYGSKLANGDYSWVNISGVSAENHLPRSTIYAIVIDPDKANRIFVATSRGIYYTESAGVSWKLYNQGMPSVIRVFDLKLRRSTKVLYATAYGRGIYRRWIG